LETKIIRPIQCSKKPPRYSTLATRVKTTCSKTSKVPTIILIYLATTWAPHKFIEISSKIKITTFLYSHSISKITFLKGIKIKWIRFKGETMYRIKINKTTLSSKEDKISRKIQVVQMSIAIYGQLEGIWSLGLIEINPDYNICNY